VDNLGLCEVMMLSHATKTRFRVLIVAMLPALAACGSVPIAQMSVLPDGLYEFDQHLPVTNFSGRLRIQGDSVKIVETSPPCFEVTLPPTSGQRQGFTCGDFSLATMRGTTGRWTFTYSTTVVQKTATQTCTTVATSDGRKGCLEADRQTQQRDVVVTGALALRRVGDAEQSKAAVP
jgi:hypothetical protein